MTSSDLSYDGLFAEIERLHWKPWVGERYKLIDGKKLLIVGESHYCWKNEKDDPVKVFEDINKKWFTRKIIHESGVCSSTKSKQPILRNIEKVLTNKAALKKDIQKALWHSVSFYNFIQRPLMSREKQHRPTETDWQNGWHTFYKVIEILKPDYILFCGVEAVNREFAKWNAIKKTEYQYTNKMTKTKNRIGRTFIRSKGSIQKIDTQLIISCIDHPSSRFSWNKWHRVLNEQMPHYITWLGMQSITNSVEHFTH